METNYLLKTLLLLAIAQVIALNSNSAFAEALELETFCDGNNSIKFEKISQVTDLIEQLISATDGGGTLPKSCEKYSNSILRLKPILEQYKTGETCNLKLTDLIRDYHYEFINGSAKNNPEDSIPHELRVFFISFCFQISAECKMSLINNLETDIKGKIVDEDYDIMVLLQKYGVTLLDDETKVNDFDDILLLNDLNLVMNSAQKSEQQPEEAKIMIKIKTNLVLKDLIGVCRNKFKPFYEKLILPLIALSNLGYNYQGELLAKELEELKRSELIMQWYNIVQTCEIFSAIEIYEDNELDLGDQQAITLISSTEAEASKLKQIGENSTNIARISYRPKLDVGDNLWISDQSELQKLVNNYKATATENSRIRKKLMKKLYEKFKGAMKTGKIGIFVSELANGIQSERKKSVTNVNEDMLLAMDSAIDQAESINVVDLNDSPVAFGKKNKLPPRKPVPKPAHTMQVIPAKVKIQQEAEDQSGFFTKLFNRTIGRLIPSKFNLCVWFIGIIGLLLIVLAILSMG